MSSLWWNWDIGSRRTLVQDSGADSGVDRGREVRRLRPIRRRFDRGFVIVPGSRLVCV